MLEIKCPKCGEIIKLGKDEYNALLQELDTKELDRRVEARAAEMEKRFKTALELETNKAKTAQDGLIADLRSQISLLNERLKGSDKNAEVAVMKATEELKSDLSNKDVEIASLKTELEKTVKESVTAKQDLEKKYAFQLAAKDEEIQHWKEFRTGDSTKDIGEALEQFCEEKFNEIRAVAYPNAIFEKDTVPEGRTKGDYIFRDFSPDDPEHETVSIMFDMKNQKEDGDTKNESHFKKLDSDRTKKNCEYAVLVSTLEPNSDLYNAGIVDVSYKYPKMFVVRPQFFLAIIGLIKNMAQTRFEYKRQVIRYQRENVDITNFENAVRAVAQKIGDDYENAGKQYDKVEKMCDDMIKKLTDLKETFRLGKKWIGAAQNQLPELEIRKLTKNNETMRQKFEALDYKDGK